MYYEINVARKGIHLFATAKRSLTTRGETLALYREFKEKFTDCELAVTYQPESGSIMTEEFNKLLEHGVVLP